MQSCEENKGITVIALVITIIVLLILAGTSISMITGEDGIINHASTAKIVSELSGYKESLELFKASKIIENSDFYEGSLTSGKTNLVYNTKTDDSEQNIRDVIKGISDEYIDIMEIIKGELLLNTQDRKLIKIAHDLGIQVNPYIIIDGELMSSDTNLLLVDENGALTIPESVTSIGNYAFSHCTSLTCITIPNSVTSIGVRAFENCSSLENIDISNLDTRSVKEMKSIFEGCENLKQIDISNFDTHSVTTLENIFNGCSSLSSLDLSNFNADLVTSTMGMFKNCKNLQNINLNKFEPETVNNFAYMFYGCSSLESLDLSNFNTKSAQNITYMFDSCTKLQNLDLSKFNTMKCNDFTNVFNDCKELTIKVNPDTCQNLIERIPIYVNVSYV